MQKPMKHVLIVEPNLALGMVFSRAFLVAGYGAKHVTEGAESARILEDSPPRFVVLNAALPADQANMILKVIKERYNSRRMPVIAYTLDNKTSPTRESRFQDAAEFLTLEEANPKALLEAADRVLNSARTPGTPPPETEAPPPAEPESVADPAPIANPPDPAPKQTGLQSCKTLSQKLLATQGGNSRYPLLLELHESFHAFNEQNRSMILGLGGKLCDALDSLVHHLCHQPSAANSSTLRTVFQAINSLDTFLKHGPLAAPPKDLEYRALVVDDQPEVLALVEGTLEIAGVHADTSKDATEALALSKQHSYDLFLFDVMMPGLSGFELCEKIRESSRYKATPVVFITGADGFDSRIRSASSGGSDFIAKPFMPTELAVKALFHLLPR